MKRIIIYDYLKAFAILLVIYGHILSNCINHGNHLFINGLLSSIHIPLFLVISGIFIKEKDINSLFWKNIIKRFIIPYLIWSIILSIYYIGSKIFDITILKDNLQLIAQNCLYSFLWFIKAYVISYVLWQLIPFISCKTHIMRNFLKLLIGTLLLVCINLIAIRNKYWSEIFSLSLYTYTILGTAACIKDRLIKVSYKKVLIAIILFLIFLPYTNIEYSYFNASFAFLINSNKLYIFIIRFILAFSCVTIILYLANQINKYISKKNSTSTLIENIGQNTLPIYMIQSLCVEAILPRFFKLGGGITSQFIAFIIAMIMTYICHFIIQKTRKLKYINLCLWGIYK